jgi:ribosomal protein S18 acetylase RimI-like enzyme
LRLYRDVFGFEIVGERKDYYSDGSDALVLRRVL